MPNSDIKIFDDVSLSDLFRDIYNHSNEKRETIEGVVTKLVELIKTPEDAIMLAPVTKEFLEVGVKNDEQLVKMATVVQRIVQAEQSKQTENGDWMLSEEERNRLLENAKSELKAPETSIHSELKDITDKASQYLS